MNLSALDLKFIHLLVHNPEHREILKRSLGERQIFVTGANWMTATLINTCRFLLLILESITTIANRSSHSFPGDLPDHPIFFYDSNPESLPHRQVYLVYHLGEKAFHGISYKGWLRSPPELGKYFLYLFRLGVLIFLSFFHPSTLSRHYTRIFRTCFLVNSRLPPSQELDIYLFRLYQPETKFLAPYLRERQVKVHLVPSTTPLTPYNRDLIGDELVICNPYQIDEFRFYRERGICRKHIIWSPEEITLLAPYYSTREKPHHADIFGVYTQGFWLRNRMKLLEEETGTALEKREQELMQILHTYTRQHPEIMIKIFPHPMERRHFTRTGEHQFSSLEKNDSFSLDFTGKNSIYTFDQVGLGLTTVSTIGFDRVYMGFRTLFFVTKGIFLNLEIPSPYNQLFCQDESQLLNMITRLKDSSDAQFIALFFAGEFWNGKAYFSSESSVPIEIRG